MTRLMPDLRAVSLIVLTAGCTGAIDPSSGDPGGGGPSSESRPGGPMTGGPMTGGPMTGPGSNVTGANTPFQPGAASLRRLTVRQYSNTVRDLLGSKIGLPTDLQPDVVVDGFPSIGASTIGMSATATERLEAAAVNLSQQAVADSGWRAANVRCTPAGVADDACARDVITTFGRRAWRRPLTPDEVTRYAQVASSAATTVADFWRGLGWAVAGILQSPYFLYRVELGSPDPSNNQRKRLDGYELGSRLSYAILESTPDDQLLAAAAAGQLSMPAGLRAQAERLLTSPRAPTGLIGFFNDRFHVDDLDDVDHTGMAGMTPTLLTSMQKELLALVNDLAFVRDADTRELMDGKTTFVNDELAKLYGLPLPGKGAQLMKTALPADSPRGGYLGQGSFLALNAHATTTNPTKRGKFVREVLLCQTIPDPPANVPPLPSASKTVPQTLRDRLEMHRQDPACAGCHSLLDPIGLAFENFNAIGGYRTTDGGKPIDASGDLEGVKFADAAGLARAMRERPDTSECLTRALFRYALGHRETAGEEPAIKDLGKSFASSGFRFLALVRTMVDSDAFRYVAAGP